MKRDSSLDVFRVCLMLGICLLHSITQAGHNMVWAANMLSWCVPGFMFISGWFGIKFSFIKVLKLYGMSLYCAVMYVFFDCIVSRGGGWQNIYKIAINQWFLNAYVVVMCLVPVVNLAITRLSLRELLPMLLCVFGWSFATTCPIIGRYIPSASGLTSYSFLTLLGVYICARYIRKLYDLDERFKTYTGNKKILVLIIAICLILSGIGMGDYNSPFSLILAGSVFLLFNSFSFPDWTGKICLRLGPSMFAVYLMHSHVDAWGYLRMVQDYFLDKGLSMGFAYVLTALSVFGVCVVADLPRRWVVMWLKKRK